ncbi:FxsB family radical SAM/SPASM domain protein [Dactylosporangium aurantiacum]|uniref:FxsB family radical SAM/SPASM domain protein n=1 Tax=Dactylosporangium aurantiacum TaxID=35754 RepID=A0A9Q9MC55_9ACTN|nr:FxsB family cyclophane-forming radical SAM/SPASM peptide maturase [Dactylosporangium aurantiacum]MDG6106400.1 FxsB family radical SAM/SPASM domain protein [Dactylosporangium aurantiacum]UWZ50559.1 FxsB family radical SAM/SPASM domain protein [Dactylosporangium aurantiacum]
MPQADAITEYVLKVHSRCDLRCDHCYVYVHRDQTWSDRPKLIDPAVAHRVAERIAEHARAHRLHRVRVVLHGGEPLLLGPRRLDALLTDLRETVGPVAALDLVLQSNGVQLTEELCGVFVRHGVRVGISLDGDAEANDRHRRFGSGASSHAAVLRALELLRRPEFRPAYGGILCTVDVANDPDRVYTALLAERPPRIDFLLPHATWDDPPPRPVSTVDGGTPYADWLLRIYHRWLRDGRPVPVRLFDSLRSTAVGGPSQTESVGLDPVALVVIETDGAWEQADSLKTAFHGAAGTGMSVWTHSLDEVAAHPDIAARRDGAAELCATCRACPVLRQCGGGLRAHRFRTGSGFDNPSVYCADLKELILSMRAEPEVGTAPATMEPGPRLDALLDDLASGAGSAGTTSWLLEQGQLYAKALLMDVVGSLSLPAPLAEAWQLLNQLAETAPDAFGRVLRQPWLRQWLLSCLPDAEAPADLGYLATLTGAAAVHAGADARLWVPVRDGRVHLPGLGSAVTGPAPGGATLRVTPDGFTVTAPGSPAVAVRHGRAGEPPGWLPARHAGPDDWPVLLDDLDAHRDCQEWPVADRLDDAAARAWDARLRGAWTVLTREAPDYLPALRGAVHTVVPLRDDPAGEQRSSTRREAFAAVGLAAADDAATAVLLVHELQHVKLGALLDLCELGEPDNLTTVTVPWRDDERPVEAALQGLYAHLAVADLWRRRTGAEAAGNFRRYRTWVSTAAAGLRRTSALTGAGTRFVAGIQATVDGWPAPDP